jgi:Periplasmic component of the Tol biopolymer transport system
MPKGSIYRQTFRESADELTGRRVTLVAGGDSICHHPYFYNKMVTAEGRLVTASDRGGKRDLWLVDLRNGESLQLTDSSGRFDDFSALLSADDGYLLYSAGNGIWRLDLSSLKEERLFASESGWRFGSFGVDPGDSRALVSEMAESDVVESRGDWSSFEPQWEAHPHCRLVSLDLETGISRVAHEEMGCWLGHPQPRPGRPDELLFCHEGPQWRIDARLWLVDADGSRLRCAKPRRPEDMIVTHEFWSADGSAILFVHKDYDNRATIRSIDPETLSETIVAEFTYSAHVFASPDGRWFVADGQPAQPVLPETGKDSLETMANNIPNLYLIDSDSGREEVLCRHGSSFKPYGNAQDCHPHPSFAPDSKSVLFSSDRDGRPAVYRVEI